MTYELYPPLAIISSDFSSQDAPAGKDAHTGPAHQESGNLDMAMPAFLRDLVDRRAASQAAFPPAPPAAGQIRCFAHIPEAGQRGRALGRVYGVLLGSCLGGRLWSGWIVAQEADYATDRDLLLDEQDGPVAPEAAMIQAWNPVQVLLQGDEAILGKIAPQRLAAVMVLADGAPSRDAAALPRPGRIGAWNLDQHTAVVTGTPMGDETDPRQAYQRLYRDLAAEISTAAARQPASRAEPARRGWLGRLNQFLVRPVWTYAALTVVLGQSVWLLASGTLAPEEDTVYRSATHVQRSLECVPRIRVIFKPDASYADVAVALRRVGATLADGPSETGEVWITLPTDQGTQEAARMLRISPLVEAADIVSPDKGRCGK